MCPPSECLVLEVRVVLSLVAAVGYTGKRFASADRKGEIRLWDPTKGQQQGQPLTAHKQWVTSLAWEPLHRNSAGERLASSSKDALIKVKYIYPLVIALVGAKAYIVRARGSSRYVVTRLVRRCCAPCADHNGQKERSTIPRNTNFELACIVSITLSESVPCRFVVGQIWNTRTGRCEVTLSGHADSVEKIIWGGEGLLYSASRDRTIKVGMDNLAGAFIFYFR